MTDDPYEDELENTESDEESSYEAVQGNTESGEEVVSEDVQTSKKSDNEYSKYVWTMEPYSYKGKALKVVVALENKDCLEMSLLAVGSKFNERDKKKILSFVRGHEGEWLYMSEFLKTERLDSGEKKRAPFDYESYHKADGCPLAERLFHVSNRIKAYLKKHLDLRGVHDGELISVFVISTYFKELLSYAPRLMVKGISGSGKSTLADFLRETCYRAFASGDTTGAAVLRQVDRTGGTVILDEFQDNSGSAKEGLERLLKVGISPGAVVSRTEHTNNGALSPRFYQVFAPVAFFLQTSSSTRVREEIENRSVKIMMVPSRRILPIDKDADELREIRNELYSTRILWLTRPVESKFQEIREKALEEVQSREGLRAGGKTYRFFNRSRDIAASFVTIAKLTGDEEGVIIELGEMQASIKDMERDSEQGFLYRALLSCIEARRAEYPLYTALDALTSLSTREIADSFVQEKDRDGELPPNTTVPTRSVTNMLLENGFELERDKSSNRSYLSPRGAELVFEIMVNRYGSEDDIRKYGGEPSGGGGGESKQGGSTESEELNNLMGDGRCED